MDDITVVAQDDPGSQVLMDAVQEFEFWSNTKLNMTKTVAMNINDEGEEKDTEWQERVVQIRRVTKVVKGGKKLSFRAVLVVGNEKGEVGVGVGKASYIHRKCILFCKRNI